MPLGWNIFRYLADLSHLISIVILLYKMFKKKSCVGVSLKTHILYLTVYVFRYVNETMFAKPYYNVFFKIFYISSSILIITLILTKFKATYEKRYDTFRITFIYIICIPLAYFTSPRKTRLYLLHSYSLWIEAFSILPQLFLLVRSRKVNIMNQEYIFFLSIYRLFYLLNWIYKAYTDTGSTSWNLWLSGITQTIIYSDFIYNYIKMKVSTKEYELPY